ncbi:hypothetical protein MnTg02_00059 [bacterium MnTg02]|nr:hypothetical protein MnTg02_00059 [bacterium MnTg02]
MNYASNYTSIGIVRAALCLIVSAACLVPSAAMNVQVRMATGGNLSVALACILSVMLAATLVIIAEDSWKSRQFHRLVWAVPLFLVLFFFNLSNAVSLAGADRTAYAEPRTKAIQTMRSLKATMQTMQTERERYSIAAGGKTPGMIEAEISSHQLSNQKVWNRTDQCSDVTRDDSGNFCAELAGMTAKLSAANKVVDLDGKIADTKNKITKLPVYSETESPHVSALVNVYSAFWPVTDKIRKHMRVGSDVAFGVVVETLAAFGPMVFALLLWPENLGTARPRARARAKKEPVKLPVDQSAATFLAACVTARKGSNVPSSDLYSGYKVWCVERGIEPITLTAFGTMAGKFYDKRRIGNRMSYLDIALKERVKLVAA